METNLQNICVTCGTRYSGPVPSVCTICADDRQYVPAQGQQWTSLEQLAQRHAIRFSQVGQNLYDLRLTPSFAIGQRAFFIQTAAGNILWDCLPLLDPSTLAFLRSMGGVQAIALSHPHYYSLMSEWAREFDCPVYLHQADEEWIMDRPQKHLKLWTGDRQPLWEDIDIVHTGGHFPGSTVLHLPHHGPGTLLTGDTIYVTRNPRWVTCMYSYPNLIPLPKNAIERITKQVTPLAFDRLYAAFDGMDINQGAKEIFTSSMNSYLSILGDIT